MSRLDGLRAVAIIGVFIYHFTWFWTSAAQGQNLLPYDDVLAFIPMADVGYLGVYLFFLISGQVILITLERTKNPVDFFIKRVARLWPTLILCGTLTFIVVSILGPPELQSTIPEYLISLLILPPNKIAPVFGASDWQWLDGAYWSLWVEVRFYALFGLIFYVFNKYWFYVWILFSAFCFILTILVQFASVQALEPIGSILIYQYLPFFTLGIAAQLRHRPQYISLLKWVIPASLIHIIILRYPVLGFDLGMIQHWIGLAFIIALYAMTVENTVGTKWLEPLSGIGRASYSFYLLHQVLGVSLIVGISTVIGPQWSVIMIAPLFLLLLVTSSIIYEKYEQPMNRLFVGKFVHTQKAIMDR
ncbi:MAG: acyltransferase [Hyphomonadaceae bacterium]|nr:acyltransferase [Hyphomonadaceae bacterium]